MHADSEKIKKLLEQNSQYHISKETGVNQSILSRVVSGERKIENLTFRVASVLTEYAEKIEKKEQS
ncbi:Uncharacterised protein [Alloiococcus otitis]|uniref:HTH cro/C1-type domain-containing protein n=1 Tax=Alloiococcus otitis ATCC 51267 TaxID=883081 RepID=K9EW00_9LACT|nr:hypothetical protein [Alloiococcus otitis]EKU93350.1 hypothetical protein HMPREF9698_01098 [Alloiococcus otitis ATCC 51267]SUU81567.1 Uncharacterised protein [Alloiococcus otitis]